MSDNSSSRKKTVMVSLLTFLLIGGAVFLFFIVQGSKDITKSKNSNFQFNSLARGSLAPFFRYLGVDVETPKNVHEARVDKFIAKNESADMDMAGWLAESAGSGGSAAARPDGGAYASGRAPSVIPRMEGGRGGFSSGGGGQSNSSGGGDRFSEGSDKRNTKISASASSVGAGAASGRGGSLGSLRNARAMLSGGLRSGSAMTAKSSWDKSFAAGGGGARGPNSGAGGGSMSYEKAGLVGLDNIKTGEVADFKISDPSGAAAVPGASPPKLVDDSDSKGEGESLADVSKNAMSGLVDKGIGFLGGKEEGVEKAPPPEIKKVAERPHPEGYYCKEECNASEKGVAFLAKDDELVYKQDGDSWSVTFKGEYLRGDAEHKGDPYAKYEQTFDITTNEEGKAVLTPRDAGSCIMPNGVRCPAPPNADYSYPGAPKGP